MPVRKRSPSNQIQHQILAVVDQGDKADYRPEVRYRITIEIPFRLTRRSGIRQLTATYQEVVGALAHLLPTPQSRLHVWSLDGETGEPDLFLSGLLRVRQGQLSRQRADRLDSKIRPQVTEPQQSQEYRFVLNASAHGWGCAEDFCDEDVTGEDLEHLVQDGIFGGFDYSDLFDSDPSDDNSVYVAAEVWHQFTLDLPFRPSNDSSVTLLGYLVNQAIWQLYLEFYDIGVDELDVWLLDESGQPTECISGWLEVKEGSSTAAEMRTASRRTLKLLPLSFRSRAA
jgi:hypothetical protein